MKQQIFDIAIIGGGASGIVAAIEAKRYGGSSCRVVILEKNARIGKKILATGNGRCNFGNVSETDPEQYSGSCTALIPSLFQRFTGSDAYFRQLGVISKKDSGRLYPYSNHAASVLDALRFELQQLDATVKCDFAVTSITDKKTHWMIASDIEEIHAKILLIACGGNAAPAMGTSGDLYEMIGTMGHSVVPVKPALCPIPSDSKRLKPLKGIRVPAKVQLTSKNGKILAEDTGEVQFTEQAVSGICVFNLSAHVNLTQQQYLVLDLMPDCSEEELIQLLWEIYAVRSTWLADDFLTGLFQKKLCLSLFHDSGMIYQNDAKVYTIESRQIEALAATIKHWKFPVKGIGTWQQAQTTAGGVPADEIHENLQSAINPRLFFAGEILDIAGKCGGFNLAWAWCTGTIAGQAAADVIINRKERME